MKRSLRYIVLLLALTSFQAFAQKKGVPVKQQDLPVKPENAPAEEKIIPVQGEAQGEKKKEKKEKKQREPLRLKAFRVGIDLAGPLSMTWQPNRKAYDFQTDFEVNDWLIALEAGHEQFSESMEQEAVASSLAMQVTQGYTYAAKGNYLRFGFDRNLLPKSKHVFFLGARYGYSLFEEELSYAKDSYVYGAYTADKINETARAGWFEITAGLKARIFKNILMGYTIRYKFRPSTYTEEAFATSYMPGFGRLNGKGKAGFNYYLIYEIPFK